MKVTAGASRIVVIDVFAGLIDTPVHGPCAVAVVEGVNHFVEDRRAQAMSSITDATVHQTPCEPPAAISAS